MSIASVASNRAETAVREASHMSANQLLKCARVLHALAALASTEEQRTVMEDHAARVEGMAWDKALRHQIDHAN